MYPDWRARFNKVFLNNDVQQGDDVARAVSAALNCAALAAAGGEIPHEVARLKMAGIHDFCVFIGRDDLVQMYQKKKAALVEVEK